MARPGAIETEATQGDLRFMRLLGAEAWGRLPAPVQRRFAKRLTGGRTIVYVGEVLHCQASLAGKLLAVFGRLIGGPLPLIWTAPCPSVVTVTENGDGGQTWSRLYVRPHGFPQTIHSAKRFEGPTGLEEHVGGGVGMALNVTVEEGVLAFRSAFYFITLGRRRIRLPRAIEPGRIRVTHAELGHGRFEFTLAVDHPLFGTLIRQRAVYREADRLT